MVYVLTGCSQVYGERAKFIKSLHFLILAPQDEVNSFRNLKISPFIIYLFIDISDKLVKRQVSALEEFNKFSTEMAIFRTWLEKAYKILEDKERQLANLNKVQGSIDDIKTFVSDVMTHGADLKFLTISGQKFVDLSKVGVTCLAFHCYL